MKIITVINAFFLIFFFDSYAFAATQKYKRTYQKYEKTYQKGTRTKTNYDLPESGAYIEVSRKRPTVTVNYQPEKAVFVTNQAVTMCDGLSKEACTLYQTDVSLDVDCRSSNISLNAKDTLQVSVSAKYKQGTCGFDALLKQELTNAKMYRENYKAFLDNLENEVKSEYTSLQRKQKGCKTIKERLDTFVNQSKEEYKKEFLALKENQNKMQNLAFKNCFVQR